MPRRKQKSGGDGIFPLWTMRRRVVAVMQFAQGTGGTCIHGNSWILRMSGIKNVCLHRKKDALKQTAPCPEGQGAVCRLRHAVFSLWR